jgi:hypothetical protein
MLGQRSFAAMSHRGPSLGGSDDVSNLFLMCRECHDLMPNTKFPEIFFEWARAQSWNARESAKISEAIKAFGIEEALLPNLEQVIISEDFWIWSEGKSGLHWPQSNYAPISSRLTPATTVGLAVYYLRTFGTPRPQDRETLLENFFRRTSLDVGSRHFRSSSSR